MPAGRIIHVGIAMALTVTAAGFFSGIRGSAAESANAQSSLPPAGGVPTARSYSDARAHRYGPNAGMYDGAVSKLGVAPDVNAKVEQTEEQRLAALAKRASRRAYDGAPPTIPHRVLQMGPLDCVSCHESGAKVGSAIAPKISHPLYQSCTQCHVVMNDPRPGAPAVLPPGNDFQGLTWGKGTRAWKGAPPTVPHPTAMRSDCTSCHGTFGADGIKSTHPWRQSCTQCHALDAEKDQHPQVASP